MNPRTLSIIGSRKRRPPDLQTGKFLNSVFLQLLRNFLEDRTRLLAESKDSAKQLEELTQKARQTTQLLQDNEGSDCNILVMFDEMLNRLEERHGLRP